MDPPNTIPLQDAKPSPITILPPDANSIPETPLTTVTHSTSSSTIDPTPTASEETMIQPTSSTTTEQTMLTSTTTTRLPTPITTTKTRQIDSGFKTTTTAPPRSTPILSTESSKLPIPKIHSDHSSAMTPTTTSFTSDTPLLSPPTSSLTSYIPPSTSATHFLTNSDPARISISQILPAVLVPLFGLIVILTAVFLIRRSRRRLREQKAKENPLPFLSHSPHTPSGVEISEKRSELHSGFCNFVYDEGLSVGREGESRPREDVSTEVVGGSGAVPELREQIFVLQAQLADIELHGSHAPPDYSSAV